MALPRRSHAPREWLVTALVWSAVAGAAGHAHADLYLSPDVSVELSGRVVHDEDVGQDDLVGSVVVASLGGLPAGTDVDAFALLEGGGSLISFDTTVELPSGIRAEPRDVVRWDGSTYGLYFDGSAAGVPNGVRIDAVTLIDGYLAVSFDTAVDLAGIVVQDEDLVRVQGGIGVVFDGSSQGIDPSLDLDGASEVGGGVLALSFDGSGEVGGIVFDDEDVLRHDPASGSWSLLYDGSALHAGLEVADLDAVHYVPEPGALASLVCGIALLRLLYGRRGRNPWRTER